MVSNVLYSTQHRFPQLVETSGGSDSQENASVDPDISITKWRDVTDTHLGYTLPLGPRSVHTITCAGHRYR